MENTPLTSPPRSYLSKVPPAGTMFQTVSQPGCLHYEVFLSIIKLLQRVSFRRLLKDERLCVSFSGGFDRDANVYSDKIMIFNKETRIFEDIGILEQSRSDHSMSLVDSSKYNCI